MSFLQELKRRNVFRVGIAYAVAAWLLLQIADVLIDNIGAPDWVFPTLLMALGIGFPLALIFAWAFELTPEGLKRESEVDRQTSITRKTGRKLDRTIIVVLALAVGYLLVDKLVLQQGARDVEPSELARDAGGETSVGASVAVLPFANMSNDPDNEYFSDGLTDTLLHMLAQLPELRVAARTSSFAFKGRNIAIPEIAGALGVDNVLEGSVQRAGDQVRVTAQLIRAADGFHVWSQNYTRPLEDIFAIQDEIASDVARALDASLLGGGDSLHGVETRNLGAYDTYLRGLEQESLFTYASLEESEVLYERALAMDPEFTEARLALARNYLKKADTGIISDQEAARAAAPLIEAVQQAHPESREAEALECVLTGRFNPTLRDRQSAETHIRRCEALLALVPTDTFVRTSVSGGIYFVLDDAQGALDLVNAGLLIDPLSVDLYNQKATILFAEQRLDETEAALRRAIELAPGNPASLGRMADLARERNDLPRALDWTRRIMEVDPDDHEPVYELAWEFYGLQLPEEAERYYVRVQSMVPGSGLARSLDVARLVARDELDLAIEVAAAMIEDQVTTRRGAFWTAAFYYTDLMMRQEREREAYDFLVRVRPEITDYDTLPDDWQGRLMQEFSVALMSGFADFDTRRDAWRRLVAANEAAGFPLLEGATMTSWDLLIEGRVEEAISWEIEERLKEPLAGSLWRHRKALPDLNAPIYEDPRYEAARAARERDFLALRAEVEELLLEPEWTE